MYDAQLRFTQYVFRSTFYEGGQTWQYAQKILLRS